MDFEYSAKTRELMQRVDDFMQQHVYPVEHDHDEFVQDPANRWAQPPVVEELKRKARAAGLWNLFLPHEYGKWSPGLTNLEYAPLAELMGRIEWAPRCSTAPPPTPATWKCWPATAARGSRSAGSSRCSTAACARPT